MSDTLYGIGALLLVVGYLGAFASVGNRRGMRSSDGWITPAIMCGFACLAFAWLLEQIP